MTQIDIVRGEYNLPVDIVHRERLDTVFSQELLLAAVDVTEANVDKLLRAEHVLRLQPPEAVFAIFLGKTCEEGDRHAVDVAAV